MPFAPVRTLDGSPPLATRRYRAVTSAALFIGDTVRVSAGVVKPSTAVSGTNTIVGVVARVYDGNGKPFTHAAPARGPGKPAATSGFADVYTNPTGVFSCTVKGCSTQASAQSLIGARVRVSAGTPNTATGLGGQVLVGTAITSANEGTWIVTDISPLSRDGLASGDRLQLEVTPAFHAFRP